MHQAAVSQAQKKEIDRDIKTTTQKLKDLLAAKKGLKPYVSTTTKKIKTGDKFHQYIVFKFRCPYCKSYNTKRSGTTTQLEIKARHLCLDCQNVRAKSRDKKK